MRSTNLSRPLKVLHLSAADIMLFPILRDQLRYLRDLGYEVHTASMDGPLAHRLRNVEGFPWTALPLDRSVAPLKDWRSVRFIEKFCREAGFQIVHTHTPKGNFVGQWGARRAGVPIVLQTLHGFYFHENMKTLERQAWIRLEKFSAKHSDHILCQNPEDVDTALREGIAGKDQITLLGNGIDLNAFRPDLLSADERRAYRKSLGIPEGALVVGMCGRFVTEKGYPELFEAARKLMPHHPALHFLLAGHKLDSERSGESCRPEEAGLPQERVRVLYDRDDMPRLYACMDLHVLPSHREGFPRVLIEGAASGLPQVATAIRGCRQTIKDQETGFLVPLKDPPSLIAGIERLLKDASLRLSMGRAARAMAEREFDQRQVFKIVSDCYDDLIRKKMGPAK